MSPRFFRLLLPVMLLALLLTSCNYIANKFTDQDDAVARVNKTYLNRSEIRDIVPKGTPARDSLAIVNNYINNWIRNQLILQHAEKKLTDEQQDFSRQMEEYRKSLIVYTFEQKLIEQTLDTLVTEAQIETYYEENKSNFELRENIVKVIAFKINTDSIKAIKLARTLLKPDSITDLDALESFCLNRTQQYIISYDVWYLFSDLLKMVPITTYNESLYLENHNSVEIPASKSIYLIRFYDFRIKNGVSPLSLERTNIKNILLNRRKVELINKMRDDLYQKADKKNEFEIY